MYLCLAIFLPLFLPTIFTFTTPFLNFKFDIVLLFILNSLCLYLSSSWSSILMRSDELGGLSYILMTTGLDGFLRLGVGFFLAMTLRSISFLFLADSLVCVEVREWVL